MTILEFAQGVRECLDKGFVKPHLFDASVAEAHLKEFVIKQGISSLRDLNAALEDQIKHAQRLHVEADESDPEEIGLTEGYLKGLRWAETALINIFKPDEKGQGTSGTT